MQVTRDFDHLMMAWLDADKAKKSTTDPAIRHLAETMSHLTQALAQIKLDIDDVRRLERQVLDRLNR